MRRVIGMVVTVWLMAGCASAPHLTFSETKECTRGGGWWRSNLGICEIQGDGKH